MAMLQKLAKMEKVGIKQVWQYEASDFTPWLAENISLLSEVIDLSIEHVKTEASVGKYSLDILARDSDSGKYVVIENQYGDTNHDHLGKLLTYAAGYDAYAAIWVAESFTDEHRKALDLLNQRTGEDTQFFGLEVELLKIGDSLPAVNFNLVSGPPAESKTIIVPPTDEQLKNRQFQEMFLEKLRERYSHRKWRISDHPYRVIEYASQDRPVDGITYNAFWHTDGTPYFEILINNTKDGAWNAKRFERLEQDIRDIEEILIEAKVEDEVVWNAKWGNQGSRIAIRRVGDVYQEQEEWDEYQNWMLRKYEKFKEVFGPRLAELVD